MSYFLVLIMVLALSGCQTMQPPKAQNETNQDVVDAVGSMAEALSGQEMTEEEVQEFVHELRTDEEARTAVESITDSVSAPANARVKYSPATGKRYASSMEYDPETGVKLEYVE